MKQRKLISITVVLMLSTLVTGNLHISAGAARNTTIKLKAGSKSVTKKTLSMKVGNKKKLKIYLNNKKMKNSVVTFQSSKKSVAIVNKKGVIKAKKVGSTKITVSVKQNGKQYKSQVKVKVMKKQKLSNLEKMTDISIKIGNKTFPAKIYNNDAGTKLLSKMPFTLNMEELNGNEKYYYFDDTYKTSSKNPRKINKGDIKLYGSDCLVLFYKSLSTSYRYTDIGYITDTEGLEKAVGNGNVKITFQK